MIPLEGVPGRFRAERVGDQVAGIVPARHLHLVGGRIHFPKKATRKRGVIRIFRDNDLIRTGGIVNRVEVEKRPNPGEEREVRRDCVVDCGDGEGRFRESNDLEFLENRRAVASPGSRGGWEAGLDDCCDGSPGRDSRLRGVVPALESQRRDPMAGESRSGLAVSASGDGGRNHGGRVTGS